MLRRRQPRGGTPCPQWIYLSMHKEEGVKAKLIQTAIINTTRAAANFEGYS